ncbi:MAG: hypothetical protein KAR42_12865 [candidate division Zixibacteria bacterium]|nr:hypothetical protein [candidate division Zixibacteria bacterium]
MLRIVLSLYILLSLTSCVQRGIKVVKDESNNRTDYILKEIASKIDKSNIGSRGSINFELKASVNSLRYDTTIIMKATVCSNKDFEINYNKLLILNFSNQADSLLSLRPEINTNDTMGVRTEIIVSRRGLLPTDNPRHSDNTPYYINYAQYIIDKSTLSQLLKEKYCYIIIEGSISGEKHSISCTIDLKRTTTFKKYCERYLQL